MKRPTHLRIHIPAYHQDNPPLADMPSPNFSTNIATTIDNTVTSLRAKFETLRPTQTPQAPQQNPPAPKPFNFFGLPRELRDEIYDLCSQEKKYLNPVIHNDNIGTLRFSIRAPITEFRLVNHQTKEEYESRAPPHTAYVGTTDGIRFISNSFQFSREETLPRWGPELTKEDIKLPLRLAHAIPMTHFAITAMSTGQFTTFADDAGQPMPLPMEDLRIRLSFIGDSRAEIKSVLRAFGQFEALFEDEMLRGSRHVYLTELSLVWEGLGDDGGQVEFATWTREDGLRYNREMIEAFGRADAIGWR